MKAATAKNTNRLLKERPIPLRLLPEDRAEAEKISRDAPISLSELGRRAYLKGLPAVMEELGLAQSTDDKSVVSTQEVYGG